MNDALASYAVKNPVESDHGRVLALLDRFWRGALVTDDAAQLARQSLERALLLPPLFFQHFGDTSTLVEEETTAGQSEIKAFLIAFFSQSRPHEGYIHFVGVTPELRERGVARALYERFFAKCRSQGRTRVRCVTSPTNERSIAFHTKMGFRADGGDIQVGNVTAKRDYDGPGLHRVSFLLDI
jgi:ribosomal protein S18 acetylase RimI-like enzyme